MLSVWKKKTTSFYLAVGGLCIMAWFLFRVYSNLLQNCLFLHTISQDGLNIKPHYMKDPSISSACGSQLFSNGDYEPHTWKIFKIYNFLHLQWRVCTLSNFSITIRRGKHTQPEGKMLSLVFHFPGTSINRKSACNLLKKKTRLSLTYTQIIEDKLSHPLSRKPVLSVPAQTT